MMVHRDNRKSQTTIAGKSSKLVFQSQYPESIRYYRIMGAQDGPVAFRLARLLLRSIWKRPKQVPTYANPMGGQPLQPQFRVLTGSLKLAVSMIQQAIVAAAVSAIAITAR